MNPTDFPQANHTFNRPASMTEAECEPLRVHAGPAATTTNPERA